jgi:hypothetical protein
LKKLLKTIDDLLRGHLTRKDDLAVGKIEIPVNTLIAGGLALGLAYGAFMGLFAPLRAENPSVAQLLATSLKVPLLFLLTLLVTYPSLYVVSALFDSKLRHKETLRLLLAAMTANLALLASFGPVTGFFTLCTESYPFMIVLNVLFFGVSGFVGLAFLRKALNAVYEVAPPPPPPPVPANGEAEDGASPPRPTYRTRPARPASLRVFTFWIIIYGVVGAQMGWVLRPFVGDPYQPFELFRAERESNFFAAFFRALGALFT